MWLKWVIIALLSAFEKLQLWHHLEKLEIMVPLFPMIGILWTMGRTERSRLVQIYNTEVAVGSLFLAPIIITHKLSILPLTENYEQAFISIFTFFSIFRFLQASYSFLSSNYTARNLLIRNSFVYYYSCQTKQGKVCFFFCSHCLKVLYGC